MFHSKTFICLAWIVGWFFVSQETWALDMAKSNTLIPEPSQATWGTGSLKVSSGFKVVLAGVKESRVKAAVKRFDQRMKKRTAIHVTHAIQPSSPKPTLIINCQGAGLPVQSVREDESYDLVVTDKSVTLSAPNPLGILHGLETLLQLVENHERMGSSIPCVTIHDKPRFAWRGLLIDVCRHFEPMEVLERNLDAMAEAKMNVFHWHLSENQGFRVESKLFPKLQEMGSDGKFYTQEEVKKLIAYARDRGIRVVPEFDMPGHSTAWFVGYPELASAPGPYKIERQFGVFDPAFDPTREEVYQFIDSFLGEMTALFPDEYFHIGGDEVNGKQWNNNKDIQAFMRAHSIKNNEELQTYFNDRLSKLVVGHGKKMMGWDEILHPGLPKGVVVHSWRGTEGLAQAVAQGYDAILSNGYYLNHMRTAAFHYGVDPLPSGNKLTPEQADHVLGGEACMWGEYVDQQTIDSRIWPRTLAVAERFWSPISVRDVGDFYRREWVESHRLEELGLLHRSNYLPMLEHLAGEGAVAPLKTLADVVEPVKFYEREVDQDTTETPLKRLVDAARPESDAARQFRGMVDFYLGKAPDLDNGNYLLQLLNIWKSNDEALEPVLQKSDRVKEAMPLSKDLSAVAELGIEAIGFLEDDQNAPSAWQENAKKVLDAAQEPKASVEIVIIPSIRKLVLAAEQWDKLNGMKPEEWNKSLDAQVEASKRKIEE